MPAASKPIVYVETSVISYYTARPSRDILVLAHQEITRQWWPSARDRFQLVVSEAVLSEISQGDKQAANRRLQVVEGLPRLPLSPECDKVAIRYLQELPLPQHAIGDAAHLAVASVHAVDYLVTWNCGHIANALIRRKLAEANAALALHTPIVCTPEELMEDLT